MKHKGERRQREEAMMNLHRLAVRVDSEGRWRCVPLIKVDIEHYVVGDWRGKGLLCMNMMRLRLLVGAVIILPGT